MKFKCIHCNINITDINKSVAFYQKALGLKVERTKEEIHILQNNSPNHTS